MIRNPLPPSSFDKYSKDKPPKRVRCVLDRQRRSVKSTITVGKEYDVRAFWIGYGIDKKEFVAVVNDNGYLEEYVSDRFEVVE